MLFSPSGFLVGDFPVLTTWQSCSRLIFSSFRMPEWSCSSAFHFVIGLTRFVARLLVRVLVLSVNRKAEWSLVV